MYQVNNRAIYLATVSSMTTALAQIINNSFTNTTVTTQANSGQAIILVASTKGMYAGMPIYASVTGIPASATILTVNSTTSVTISANLTANLAVGTVISYGLGPSLVGLHATYNVEPQNDTTALLAMKLSSIVTGGSMSVANLRSYATNMATLLDQCLPTAYTVAFDTAAEHGRSIYLTFLIYNFTDPTIAQFDTIAHVQGILTETSEYGNTTQALVGNLGDPGMQ